MMSKLISFIPRIAKAVLGAIVGGAAVPAMNTIAENPIIWSWEYMLASAFGVGISVYVIPNKPAQE